MNHFAIAETQSPEKPPLRAGRCVLFLCSGNYYRRRHAEIFFNYLAMERRAGWRAISRGLALSAGNAGPVSPHTASRVAALALNVNPFERFPLAARDEDFARVDHVVAVKGAEHRAMIAAAFPTQLSRVEFWEIHDLDCAEPQAALPELEIQVAQLLDRLVAANASD
jgi:protein-tyrosine phosphatase